jgi:hypothetical protein
MGIEKEVENFWVEDFIERIKLCGIEDGVYDRDLIFMIKEIPDLANPVLLKKYPKVLGVTGFLYNLIQGPSKDYLREQIISLLNNDEKAIEKYNKWVNLLAL